MKHKGKTSGNEPVKRDWGWIAACIALALSIATTCSGEERRELGREILLGQKMYREGILPSGKQMTVRVEDNASPPGTAFACGSCHNRSGLAVMDPVQRTPSISGPALFRPLYPVFPGLSEAEREELPEKFKAPPLRPAYTDATLARAIREGVDPNGRRFNGTMPRYSLSDQDMSVLIDYLKQLSRTPSPGATDTTLAFATVATDDVSQQDQDALFTPLDEMVRMHNALGGVPGNMSTMISMQVMSLSFRQYTLAHWILHGPPNTWRGQMESLYDANPVFAIVGGISNRAWKPVHDFCEDRQIPCLLPITELPEISATGYYTLYFSRGHYQEGEAAAQYLAQKPGIKESFNIVQIIGPGLAGKALAAGFEEAWRNAGGNPSRTVRTAENEPLTAERITGMLRPKKDSALLLWLGPESYEMLRELSKSPTRPTYVFLSSTLLAERMWELPAEARPFTYLSYPFREPGPRTVPARMGRRPFVVNKEYRKNDRRIASKTTTIIALLNTAVGQMERNFYRDYLLDLFDAMEPFDTSDYELLEFGPGRRYLSEHCSIMQMSDGADPKLIPLPAP